MHATVTQRLSWTIAADTWAFGGGCMARISTDVGELWEGARVGGRRNPSAYRQARRGSGPHVRGPGPPHAAAARGLRRGTAYNPPEPGRPAPLARRACPPHILSQVSFAIENRMPTIYAPPQEHPGLDAADPGLLSA